MIIKVSTSFPSRHFYSQLPVDWTARTGIQYVVNEPVERCDAWVVYENLTQPDSTQCGRANTFFVMGEPPAYKLYNNEWLRRNYAHVLGYGRPAHPGYTPGNTALPWWIAGSYEEIANREVYSGKKAQISAVASSKTTIRGHRRRVECLKQLASMIAFDMYGRGWGDTLAKLPKSLARYVANEVFDNQADKTLALLPYKYSIAIENSDTPHYFTEKITDCYLCGTMPIYWGCSNLDKYFPKGSYIRIDTRDPQSAANIITEAIASNTWEKNRAALEEARQLALGKYNLPQRIADYVKAKIDPNATPELVHISPEPKLGYVQRQLRKLRQQIGV